MCRDACIFAFQTNSKAAEFGHQTDPNRPPSRPKILPKLVPGGVGSPRAVPRVPQERQESTKELARSASGALQERPRAPQERPEEAQESPKSGPGLPKVSPRGVRVPFQERKRAFSEIAFSCAREHDFRGSGRPRERPKSPLESLSGPLSSDFEREKSLERACGAIRGASRARQVEPVRSAGRPGRRESPSSASLVG